MHSKILYASICPNILLLENIPGFRCYVFILSKEHAIFLGEGKISALKNCSYLGQLLGRKNCIQQRKEIFHFFKKSIDTC